MVEFHLSYASSSQNNDEQQQQQQQSDQNSAGSGAKTTTAVASSLSQRIELLDSETRCTTQLVDLFFVCSEDLLRSTGQICLGVSPTTRGK